MRYRFAPWVYAKASYEYATRLPTPDEVFGNAIRIDGNFDLQPEVSSNFNLGHRIELKHAALGALMLDLNAFVRLTDR
ncbi:MAG: TonB-dependent receptor [Polyangiaceae bacterium]